MSRRMPDPRIWAQEIGRTGVIGDATRNANHHAHRADIARAVACMPNLTSITFYEDDNTDTDTIMLAGRMQLNKLPEWDVNKANVYMCGPLPFMQAQWRDLLEQGVPLTQLHREVFGPDMLDNL